MFESEETGGRGGLIESPRTLRGAHPSHPIDFPGHECVHKKSLTCLRSTLFAAGSQIPRSRAVAIGPGSPVWEQHPGPLHPNAIRALVDLSNRVPPRMSPPPRVKSQPLRGLAANESMPPRQKGLGAPAPLVGCGR